MINVAVLGYGIVGSGVVEVINKNNESIKDRVGEEIKVSKILDIRDFPDSPDRDLLTKDSEDIYNDSTISIVVETIGGAGIAYEFTRRALQSGRHVVTSNKELVAKHGPELMKMAADNGVRYLFEASVGGGIPIIRPLDHCLAANEIYEVMGILNGTTNYILTQMRLEGKDFAEALREAQAKGYAEADPTADVEGHDACRKIAILSSMAYNEYVDYRNIETQGISKITTEDMKYAEALNSVIKLVGMSRKVDGRIMARVSPVMVGKSHPLAGVDDVFNAIVVKGNAIGEAMFYGRGAGKLPTASAVVADVIDIAKHSECGRKTSLWNVGDGVNTGGADEFENRCFVRIKTRDAKEAKIMVREFLDQVQWLNESANSYNDELAFVTSRYSEKELGQRLDRLASTAPVEDIVNKIRILE